jgi:hypothetical protein
MGNTEEVKFADKSSFFNPGNGMPRSVRTHSRGADKKESGTAVNVSLGESSESSVRAVSFGNGTCIAVQTFSICEVVRGRDLS